MPKISSSFVEYLNYKKKQLFHSISKTPRLLLLMLLWGFRVKSRYYYFKGVKKDESDITFDDRDLMRGYVIAILLPMLIFGFMPVIYYGTYLVMLIFQFIINYIAMVIRFNYKEWEYKNRRDN